MLLVDVEPLLTARDEDARSLTRHDALEDGLNHLVARAQQEPLLVRVMREDALDLLHHLRPRLRASLELHVEVSREDLPILRRERAGNGDVVALLRVEPEVPNELPRAEDGAGHEDVEVGPPPEPVRVGINLQG